jgi:hypothetical protein
MDPRSQALLQPQLRGKQLVQMVFGSHYPCAILLDEIPDLPPIAPKPQQTVLVEQGGPQPRRSACQPVIVMGTSKKRQLGEPL